MNPRPPEKMKPASTNNLSPSEHDEFQDLSNVGKYFSQSPQYFSQDNSNPLNLSQILNPLPESSRRLVSSSFKLSRPFLCSPPLEPNDNKEVPPPPQSVQPLTKFSVGSQTIVFSSSSPPLKKGVAPSRKGKEAMISATPLNSLASSPSNLFDSDIDLLLNKKSLELAPLTIHKPRNPLPPFISPDSTRNITVRRKNNRGSRHFRGRAEDADKGVRNMSLVDIPIMDMTKKRPLRARAGDEPP